ncbi:baculoviral IAP repeat-containing protein 7-like [Pristis pectinata]|uniref:baculoviral IAP repeat-containing protein 7-like n=1 Tax=Pristis pectinata TaxID=685728 RepID=UPI00223DD26C|nr:baculoviral IAP repeat-containing protein 7-like [Pristis pectinata]
MQDEEVMEKPGVGEMVSGKSESLVCGRTEEEADGKEAEGGERGDGQEGVSILRSTAIPSDSYMDGLRPFSVTHDKPSSLKRLPGAPQDLQHLNVPFTGSLCNRGGSHWEQILACQPRTLLQVVAGEPGHCSCPPTHPDLGKAAATCYQADVVDGQIVSQLLRLSNEDVALPITAEMEAEEARLRSFGNWPARAIIQPVLLAQAGFFYTGHRDNVKCFHCDGGLRNWELGDDPWMEHARWFPRCQYLLQVKGRDYVNSIQELHSHTLESTVGNVCRVTPFRSSLPMEDVKERLLRETANENVQLPPLMQSAVVQRALQMGFDGCLIEALVNSKYLLTSTQYGSVSELLSDLLEAEEEEGERRRPTAGLSAEEQLRQLKSERTCKVCMDKDVCIVFLPCGHLVVCGDCAPNLRRCPICRALIRGSVRAFMS